jgi:hypothetical protein
LPWVVLIFSFGFLVGVFLTFKSNILWRWWMDGVGMALSQRAVRVSRNKNYQYQWTRWTDVSYENMQCVTPQRSSSVED